MVASADGPIHFHLLFIVPKHEGDTFGDCLSLEKRLFDEVLSEWKRNVSDVFIKFRGKMVRDWRHPVWKPLCTYVRKFVDGRLRSNFDLHYCNPVLSSGGFSDVAFYVLKYMMKPSDRARSLQQALRLNLPEDEYNSVWSLVRPRHFESEALGLGRADWNQVDGHRVYDVHPVVLRHIRKGLSASLEMPDEPIPSVISPDDGQLRPMASYYKGRPEVFSVQDGLDFFFRSRKSRADNVVIRDDYDVSQVSQLEHDQEERVANVTFSESVSELDDLFEPFSDFIDL